MKRVLFLTNYPSPYRVRFYDLLGKSLDVTVLCTDPVADITHRSLDVTVLCTDPVADITHRDKEWFESGDGSFQLVQLPKAREIGGEYLCTQVISWLKKPYDAIVICGYSSPTAMLAMGWLRLHRIPYYMEVDGGLIRQDSGAKFRFKRALVRYARCWLSSGPHTTDYLVHYGADRQRIREYPFTSLYARDILPQAPTGEQKLALRRELGMGERKIVLYVGRFTREKGMDALLDAATALDGDTGVYFVGGEPTPALGMGERKIVLYVGRFTREKGMDALLDAATALDGDTGVYFVGGEPTPAQLDFCEKENLSNVHFVGFRRKEQLQLYYQAADVFVLPTHSDVWGLVINEAMACGLPVITTDRCVAGLELVREGVNGCLVPVEDRQALVDAMHRVLLGDYAGMGAAALETIRPYTLLVREGVNGCLVPVEDRQALVDAMHRVLLGDYAGMGAAALETIRPYTLENMARVHVDFFENEV